MLFTNNDDPHTGNPPLQVQLVNYMWERGMYSLRRAGPTIDSIKRKNTYIIIQIWNNILL